MVLGSKTRSITNTFLHGRDWFQTEFYNGYVHINHVRRVQGSLLYTTFIATVYREPQEGETQDLTTVETKRINHIKAAYISERMPESRALREAKVFYLDGPIGQV